MADTLVRVSAKERAYLCMGLEQPGGKLPLFDNYGQEVSPATIRSCLKKGYAEPWFANPMKPGWLVCRLTAKGRKLVQN